MSKELTVFMWGVFRDGTLTPVRTAEELLEVLNKHESRVEGTNAFMVSQQDELNELSPVELLAGKPFAARVTMAQEIAEGKHTDKPFTHLYSGPGYTNGVHTSQQRILDLPVEERTAKVLQCARAWGVTE